MSQRFIDDTALLSIEWTVQKLDNVDQTHLVLLSSTRKKITGSIPGYPEVCQHKNTIKAMDPDPGEKKLKEKTEKCMDIGSNF